MNNIGHKRRAKVGTWTISICLHLIAIVIFSRLALSQSPKSIAINRTPQTKIARIKEILDTSPVTSLPKITNPSQTFAQPKLKLPAKPISFQAEPKPNTLAKLASTATPASLPDEGITSSVEFFGSKTYKRKICYVVDTSGSMQGIFSSVRQNLKQSIQDLKPDQYFNIIFFGSDTLRHFRRDQLTRASLPNKTAAYAFIDNTIPAGLTNALDALTSALRLRDSLGKAPGVIYFLTDGFELTNQQSSQFSHQLLNIRKNLAPETIINTIGFWAQPIDCELLSEIAWRCGGNFTQIRTDNNE